MDEIESGGGPRTWEIHLKSGSKIEFVAAFNYPASEFTPSDFLKHYHIFRETGSKPHNPARTGYKFPKQDNKTPVAFDLFVDIAEVAAIGFRF